MTENRPKAISRRKKVRLAVTRNIIIRGREYWETSSQAPGARKRNRRQPYIPAMAAVQISSLARKRGAAWRERVSRGGRVGEKAKKAKKKGTSTNGNSRNDSELTPA